MKPQLSLRRLLLYTALLSAAIAAPAQATPTEPFSLELTYTGSNDLQQTRPTDCYDAANTYHQTTFSFHSQINWRTIYPVNFYLQNGKQVGSAANQMGVAETPSHQLNGSYTTDRQPCTQVGGGTLAEVNGVNQPEPSPHMPIYGILDGTQMQFRLAPTQHPNETNRTRMFATQYSSVGYGTSNWDATKSAPDAYGNKDPVYSLTAIFTVSLAQLRDLTEGRKESLEIDVQQPFLPAFKPWPPAGGTVSSTTSGHVKIIATCHERTKTGVGYSQLETPMKRALSKLYKELDRQRACYRFTIGYRTKDKQQQLWDKWHGIADRQGPNDKRTATQVCTALHNAHFAQCPTGGFRDSDGQAYGGPAVPGTSRHEHGMAADITVRFPRKNLKDTPRYQAAARKAGLCGPPTKDDVHVELPYSSKGKPVRCHFPAGPAP